MDFTTIHAMSLALWYYFTHPKISVYPHASQMLEYKEILSCGEDVWPPHLPSNLVPSPLPGSPARDVTRSLFKEHLNVVKEARMCKRKEDSTEGLKVLKDTLLVHRTALSSSQSEEIYAVPPTEGPPGNVLSAGLIKEST